MDKPDLTMMFVVHNAFRRDLARMRAAAAHADDPDTRHALRTGWETFTRYLTVHHTAEDRLLWPPMHAAFGDQHQDVKLLATMADEHTRLDPLMDQISTVLPQGSPARLGALFDELAAALTDHLDHEEAAALPLVQQTLTAGQWQDFTDLQRRSVGIRGAAWFFPWLLDDASRETRTAVLTLVPPPVRVLHRLIWEPRYRRRSPWRR